MIYKMIQLAFLLGLILTFNIGTTLAQTGTLTGTVIDSTTSEPLAGVNIGIRSISKGAATDGEGRYEINDIPAGTYKLFVSFVGYAAISRTVTITSGSTKEINFKLVSSIMGLNEVVVTGTGGPVEKRKIGNTIGTINTNDVQDAPISDVSELLEGRVPGMASLPSSGVTGGGSRIRIRGLASLSQSNEPVVYVDGVRIDRAGGGLQQAGISRLDDIDPASIDRVEVLKGASAATLYGTEASNGVIQIFTKQGISGPPRVSFEIDQSAIRMPDRFAPNAGFARTPAQADTMSKYFGGNIQPYQIFQRNFSKERFETGYGQAYSTSIGGGSSGFNYFVSLRHEIDNGPFKSKFDGSYPGIKPIADDRVKRNQASLTVNIFPVDKLRIRGKASYSDGSFKTFPSGNSIYATLSLTRYSKPELVAQNNSTGVPAFITVNESLQNINEEESKNFITSLNLNYRPLGQLILDGTVGINYTNTVNTTGRPFGWNIDNFGNFNTKGTRFVNNRNYLQTSFDVKATLTNQFNKKLESTFIIGTQGNLSQEHQEGVSGVNFPAPGLDVASAASQQSVSEFRQDEANIGIFGQEQIGFNDYLFTTLGARLDANSSFGSDFNAAFYPKISVSFVPSDAPFWKPSDKISSLRIRFAVGQSGLQPGAFDAFTTYSSLASATGPGIVPNNLGDPNLKPEVSTEYETGVDVSFLSNKLTLNTTYWNRTVRNALINRQYPPSGGFRSAQLTNIGQLDAQGVELGFNARVINQRDLSVSLFANGAYLWQEVADLGGLPPFKTTSSYTRTRNYVKEGYAPVSHFGAKLLDVPDGSLPIDYNGDGQPDTEQQVLDYLNTLTPQTAALPSSADIVLLADEDGDGDTVDNYLGKPFPDWSGAFGGSFNFHQFTLNTRFQYKFGNYYENNLTYAFRQASPGIGRNLPESATVERDFVTGGVSGSTPQNNGQVRLNALKKWLNNDLSLSPFSGLNAVVPADYLRWSELSLTYNFSDKLLKRISANKVSLTLAVRNLALWTRFNGTDPELNIVSRGGSGGDADEDLNEGIVAYGIPLPRRFTFKLRFQF